MKKMKKEALHAHEIGPFGFGYEDNAPRCDRYLHSQDTIKVGTATFEVFECPGHTPGGICLIGKGSADGICFVGDSLFAGGIGRCDLKGGSYNTLIKSLKKFIDYVPSYYKIYTGHGESTTLKKEISTNPYLV